MDARTYFFTGFPGFIASLLIKQLASENPKASFELLVEPHQYEKAERDIKQMVKPGQFHIIKGDITKPNLGLADQCVERLQDRVTHVYHLAAIYDLAVPADIAYRVNVMGTNHVTRFVEGLTNLQRYVYFSTAYVSGDRSGTIFEHELQQGQHFKNHYESTKYEAEVLVQAVMDHIPVTIIRPGIVMGHSVTGETAKFDGPYFIMRFLDRFAKLPIPYIGKGEAYINLVPSDYIVQATVYLADQPNLDSNVYHLTDPNPYTARDVYRFICEMLLQKTPSYTIPQTIIHKSLSIPFLRRLVQVEQETLDYFTLKSDYDCTQTQLSLRGSGISCPNLMDYLQNEIDYYIKNREDHVKQIVVV